MRTVAGRGAHASLPHKERRGGTPFDREFSVHFAIMLLKAENPQLSQPQAVGFRADGLWEDSHLRRIPECSGMAI